MRDMGVGDFVKIIFDINHFFSIIIIIIINTNYRDNQSGTCRTLDWTPAGASALPKPSSFVS